MAMQFSTTVRNAMLDAIETAIGVSAVLKIISGAKPTNIGDTDGGSVLVTMALPSDWMGNAAAGVKAKAGTWSEAAADAAGIAGHYCLYAIDGITVHSQGTVTTTSGGGDLTLDNTNIAAGQTVTITSFSWTAPNA
jgi:hypothetical protein